MPKVSIENFRHSLAHLLGAAVLDLYPGSKLAIGPSIDDGFYYDIDVQGVISDNDLPKIEKKMREILKTWKTFEGREVKAGEAKEHQHQVEAFIDEGLEDGYSKDELKEALLEQGWDEQTIDPILQFK